MTKTVVFLMTLVVVLPSDGSSQAVPSLGHRIRIKQVDGTVLTGRLATLSPETIRLSVDSSRVEGTIAIPRSQIATLESQQGTRSKRNLVGAVGLLVGGAIAVDTRELHCGLDAHGPFGCIGPCRGPCRTRHGRGSSRRSSSWVRDPHGKLGNRALDRGGAPRTGYKRIGIRLRPARPRGAALVKAHSDRLPNGTSTPTPIVRRWPFSRSGGAKASRE